MSSIASSPRLQVHAPVDSKAHWITPEEQLNQLALPMAQDLVNKNRDKLPLLSKKSFSDLKDTREQAIIASAARSILRRSKLPDIGSENQIPSLMDLTVEHILEPSPLPKSLTNWYTAHSRLKSLPEKIPSLPRNIYQIMDGKSPISSGKENSDDHFLSLIPKELGTLNKFENDILKPYGERAYAGRENPLQFRYFWDAARQEHGNVPFPETHWVFMTKDVLPGSRNKPWGEQVALVDALSKKALVDYKIPTLQQAFAAITTDMVATEERRYQAGDASNGYTYTYTRVKDTTQGYHLAVGGFAPSGVHVHDHYDDADIGVGALRKF